LPKTVVVIVGMPGSGKSEVSELYRSQGIPMFRTGDVIREEVVRRGLPLTPENSEKMARQMRDELGMDMAARITMDKVLKLRERLVCVEGPRDMSELAYISRLSRMILLVLKSDSDIRFRHLKGRGGSRDPKTLKEFNWRDGKEKERGISDVIKTRKYPRYEIENNGTLDELRRKALEVLDEIRSGAK